MLLGLVIEGEKWWWRNVELGKLSWPAAAEGALIVEDENPDDAAVEKRDNELAPT